MKISKKVGLEIISGLIILGVTCYLYFGIKDRNKVLDDNSKISYAIGEIVEILPGGRMSRSLKYEYGIERVSGVAGTENTEFNIPGGYESYLGKYFIVKFSKDNRYSELLWGEPVSDSLVKCCFGQSWNEIPPALRRVIK